MPEALNDSAAVEVPVISALLSLPLLPLVHAACDRARSGVHIWWELLLLPQLRLGSCVGCYRLLFSHVLFAAFYDDKKTPLGTRVKWEDETNLWINSKPKSSRGSNYLSFTQARALEVATRVWFKSSHATRVPHLYFTTPYRTCTSG